MGPLVMILSLISLSDYQDILVRQFKTPKQVLVLF